MKGYRRIIILWLVHFSLVRAAPSRVDSAEGFTPNNYRNYLTCIALCGKRYATAVNSTLLSGETATDWTTEGQFYDACSSFCEEKEKYDASSTAQVQAIDSVDFDRLDVTCVEQQSFMPVKVRAKLHIQHKNNAPENARLLNVVETWRAVAGPGNTVENTLTARYFTFSPRFMVPYTYANNHNQERLFIRVYSFTPDGLFGTPLCSGGISAASLLSQSHPGLILSLRPDRQNESRPMEAMVSWVNPDPQTPPECDQLVQWSSEQRIRNRWVVLDSSHTIPLSDVNSNLTHMVKVVGRRDYNGNMNSGVVSSLVIYGPNDPNAAALDWVSLLDGYATVGLCTLILLLVLFVFSCFCVNYRRKRWLKKNMTAPSTYKPAITPGMSIDELIMSRQFSSSSNLSAPAAGPQTPFKTSTPPQRTPIVTVSYPKRSPTIIMDGGQQRQTPPSNNQSPIFLGTIAVSPIRGENIV